MSKTRRLARTCDAATKLVAMALAVASIAPVGCCAARAPAGDAASSASTRRNAMPRELVLLQDGMTALNEGRPADARRSLTELLAINPEPWVHVYLARSWCLDDRNDDAFKELDIAIAAFEKDAYSESPLTCSLDLELADPENPAWQPLRADPRFAPMLERAKKCAWRPDPLVFDDSAGSQAPRPIRRAADDAELTKLREAYALDSVVKDCTSDLERVRAMCRWVYGRTSHDGWNDELPEDALGLLQVAEKGAQWRCVQYGIVVAECLNAVGIPARVVGAQARGVETILAGAGHVFAEAWLEDRQRWVFVDAQMDLVAIDTDGTPLNSAEFRNALARPEPPCSYPRTLAFCLHYFNYHGLEGEKRLMLGPVGSAMPTKFQREPTRAPDIFTHRMADAYQAPPPAAAAASSRLSNSGGITMSDAGLERSAFARCPRSIKPFIRSPLGDQQTSGEVLVARDFLPSEPWWAESRASVGRTKLRLEQHEPGKRTLELIDGQRYLVGPGESMPQLSEGVALKRAFQQGELRLLQVDGTDESGARVDIHLPREAQQGRPAGQRALLSQAEIAASHIEVGDCNGLLHQVLGQGGARPPTLQLHKDITEFREAQLGRDERIDTSCR